MSDLDLTVHRLGDEAKTNEGIKGLRIYVDPDDIRRGGMWVEHPATGLPVIVPVLGYDRDGWPVVEDPSPATGPVLSLLVNPEAGDPCTR